MMPRRNPARASPSRVGRRTGRHPAMLLPRPLSRARLRLALVAATAAALVVAALHAPAQGAPHRPATPEVSSSTHRVTLVTGDVVTVMTMADGRQVADVHRPVGAVGGVRM